MGNRQITWKKILVCYLIGTTPVLPAAIIPTSDVPELQRLSEGKENPHRPSVYVYGDRSLDALIPVKILGAVGQPGLHYVPADLDLLTLISVAGGTAANADLENVTVNRKIDDKREVLFANLEDLVSASDAAPPIIKANDTVFVPAQKQFVSDNLSKTVALVVGLASIAMSVVVIARK